MENVARIEQAITSPRVRTIREAAAFFRSLDSETAISENALRLAIKQGDIPCVSVGNRQLVALEVVAAYFAGTGRRMEPERSGIVRLNGRGEK